MITYEEEALDEIEVPGFVKYDIPGCKPLIITREDLTSDLSYYRLASLRDITLQDYDFSSYDMFLRYSFINLGLMHYPLIIASGQVGGGKSLFLAWLSNTISRLFQEKRSTTDFSIPPVTESSRWHGIKHFSLYDEDFIENVQDGMNDLGRYMKDNNGIMPPRSELEKIKIFNAHLSLDECKKYARKGLKTNLLGFVSDIITMRRHLHCGISMAYVDPASAPGLEVFEQKTHFVTCQMQEIGDRKVCQYYIQRVYGNRAGMPLTLWPDQNLDIWNSFDIPEFMPMIGVYRGNKAVEMEKKRKEKKKEREESYGNG